MTDIGASEWNRRKRTWEACDSTARKGESTIIPMRRWNRINWNRQQGRLHRHHLQPSWEFNGVRRHRSEELRSLVPKSDVWPPRRASPLLGLHQQAEHSQTGKCFLLYVQTSFLSFSSLPFLLIRESLLGSSRFQYFWQFKIPHCCRLTPPHVESIDFVILQSPGIYPTWIIPQRKHLTHYIGAFDNLQKTSLVLEPLYLMTH